MENFHVIDTIYRSQTGSVIKARRKGSRELFVLKKRLCSELGGRKDILNEVKLLKKVHNPNVIRCHDFFYDDSRGRRALYIVLEYAVSHASLKYIHTHAARDSFHENMFANTLSLRLLLTILLTWQPF